MPPAVHTWPLLTALLLRVHLSTCRLKVGNEESYSHIPMDSAIAGMRGPVARDGPSSWT